jgi:UPF0755 protein
MRRLLVSLVFLCVLLGAAALVWLFTWPFGPSQQTFVDIAPGTTTRDIAQQLQQAGIIRSPYGIELLRLVSTVTAGGSLKAGEYRFDHPLKVTEVYHKLASGQVYTIALTIPEGSNLFDIAARVQAAHLATSAAFLQAAKAPALLKLIHPLDPQATSLEGYLFPSTYRFSRHADPALILRTMVHQFQLEALALDLTNTGLTTNIHRTVTLASLVERETPIPAERSLVASVFLNRLAHGMPLQTDPTVIYAALLRGQYRGAIYQSDLADNSPYNTYRHIGLPPGPICNPGALSLKAAMHPANTDYLYFVAAGADPLGHSRFAATLAQHQKNVAAYRAAVRALPAPARP